MKEILEFTMLGRSVQIIRDKNKTGAITDIKAERCPSVTIRIKQKYSKRLFLKFLHHELIEAALHILGLDYKPENANKYGELFVFKHIDLTVLSDAVQNAYEHVKHNIED